MYVITGYRVIPSIMRILTILQQMKGSKVTVDILYTELKKNTPEEKIQMNLKSNITFEKDINISNISFSTREKKTFWRFFRMMKKKCVGIIGKSESKSTLID